MAFAEARRVEEREEKERARAAMIDRFYPGRASMVRPISLQELKATRLIVMEFETATAKVRAKGIGDDEEDNALAIYAERMPVMTVLGAPEPCSRLLPGFTRAKSLARYR